MTPDRTFDLFIEGLLKQASSIGLRPTLEAVERHMITRTLTRTLGSHSEASRLLGVKRTTLIARIRALSITAPEVH